MKYMLRNGIGTGFSPRASDFPFRFSSLFCLSPSSSSPSSPSSSSSSSRHRRHFLCVTSRRCHAVTSVLTIEHWWNAADRESDASENIIPHRMLGLIPSTVIRWEEYVCGDQCSVRFALSGLLRTWRVDVLCCQPCNKPCCGDSVFQQDWRRAAICPRSVPVYQARSQHFEKRLLASSCLSVRPSAWNNSAPTGRILMKLDIWNFLKKSVEQIQVSIKSDKNNGYFTWRRFHIYHNISLNSS